MKITNRKNLPKSIVKAVSDDYHRQGDYSTTQLPKSAKQLWLSIRHEDEIEIDVSDRLWPLFGSAIHYVLEKGNDKDAFQEEFLGCTILDKKLTGMADHFDGKIISDYKFTSVWSLVYKSSYPDWEKQLNVYAFLFGLAGFEVEKIQIIALLKDWSKNKAREATYPDCQVQVIPFELWPTEKTKDYIKGRIMEFEKYKDVADDDIPVCSAENRWEKPTKYAVMKTGRKSAVRVFDTEDEAKELLKEKDGKHSIEVRIGVDTKCVDYCDCCKFCNYWKEKYSK